MRLGVLINLDTCRDQRGCMVACKKKTDAPLGLHYVEVYTAMGEREFPEQNTYFVPIICQQCGNPSCAAVCPEGVLCKLDNGVTAVGDTTKCVDCADKPCVAACPYGAVETDPLTGKIGKCDLCVNDLAKSGYVPACAASCVTHSWLIGDLEDPDSLISQYIVSAGEGIHQLKPESGNEPAVYYLLTRDEWDADMGNLYSPAWHNGMDR